MINTQTTPESPSIGTVARKRRRQIIQQSRSNKPTNGANTGTIDESSPPCKKTCVEPITHCPRKVSDAQTNALFIASAPSISTATTTTTAAKPKKTQMRYDPDVPMTKEEAAAWRKEQRRKRNRESAAASRQRQRDRITELEQEVSDWKAKYEEALARIERLEQLKELNVNVDSNVRVHADAIGSTMTAEDDCDYRPLDSTAVSPCPSPQIRPRMSPSSSQVSTSPSEVVSLQEQSFCDETGRPVVCQGMEEHTYHVQHLSEKISRPA